MAEKEAFLGFALVAVSPLNEKGGLSLHQVLPSCLESTEILRKTNLEKGETIFAGQT